MQWSAKNNMCLQDVANYKYKEEYMEIINCLNRTYTVSRLKQFLSRHIIHPEKHRGLQTCKWLYKYKHLHAFKVTGMLS